MTHVVISFSSTRQDACTSQCTVTRTKESAMIAKEIIPEDMIKVLSLEEVDNSAE